MDSTEVDLITTISLLHRHLDGIISFAVKSDGVFRHIRAIKSTDLETSLPIIYDRLRKDSFLSINAAFTMRRDLAGRDGFPNHKTSTLRYLNASYVDIDCHTIGIDCNQALLSAKDRVDQGVLPPWSCAVRSGRGIWLLWLLSDASNPELAHFGAYTDNPRNHLQLYARVSAELRSLLESLGADQSASDAARYIRLPGSFRTDIEAEVIWKWENSLRGTPISYTLGNLAERLGVLDPPVRRTRDALDLAGKCPLRIHGREAANRNRLKAFKALQDLREGFKEGMRATAAFILAACLKQTGHGQDEVVREMEHFCQNCVPALPLTEGLSAIKNVFKKNTKPMHYQWISDTLEVTVSEAKLISDLLGKHFPPAARFDDGSCRVAVKVNSLKIRRQKRQIEIRMIVEQLGRIPSLRKLKASLSERGVEISGVPGLKCASGEERDWTRRAYGRRKEVPA